MYLYKIASKELIDLGVQNIKLSKAVESVSFLYALGSGPNGKEEGLYLYDVNSIVEK